MEKTYKITVRDKVAFKSFKGKFIHQKTLFVKYFPLTSDGKPLRDNGYYFYDYDEFEKHRIILPHVDNSGFGCYTVEASESLVIHEEVVKAGGYEYNRYFFSSSDSMYVPFFDALEEVEYTHYEHYPFADNQSLWANPKSALYVNAIGKEAFDVRRGRYVIDEKPISLEDAAEYGMFDALSPIVAIPPFEKLKPNLATSAALANIFDEIQLLMWNTHRLGYSYTLYVYMEMDEDITKRKLPISFYVVLDGDKPFHSRLYQDFELCENDQIAKNDMQARLKRANMIRNTYNQYRKQHQIEENIHMIQAHIGYDEHKQIVKSDPHIVSRIEEINYLRDFDDRCFDALKKYVWKKL